MKWIIFLVVLVVMVLDVAGRHHNKRVRPFNKCLSISPHCKECSRFDCTRCRDGFMRVPMPLGHNCWKRCPYYLIEDGDTCRPHKKDCSGVANCKDCLTNGKCTKCLDGFYLMRSGNYKGANMCVATCPEGFTGHKSYFRPPYCREDGCYDHRCFICKKGWYRVPDSDKKCHRSCPLGYVSILRSCRKCAVKNCEICPRLRFQACDKCMTDSHKLPGFFRDKCVSYCPDGYYSMKNTNGGRVCIKGKPITDEPMTSPEPTTEPEATTMPEPSTETVTSPETSSESVWTTTREPITEPETTSSESVSTTTREPFTEPETSTGRDSTTEAESTTTGAPEPFTNPEPTTTAEPYTETEYSTITIITDTRPDETVTIPTPTEWDEDDWP